MQELKLYLQQLKFKEFLESVKILNFIPDFVYKQISEWNFDITLLLLQDIALVEASESMQNFTEGVLRFMKIPRTEKGKENLILVLKQIPKSEGFYYEILQEKFNGINSEFLDLKVKGKFNQTLKSVKIFEKIMQQTQSQNHMQRLKKRLKKNLDLESMQVLQRNSDHLSRKSKTMVVKKFLQILSNAQERAQILAEETFYENLEIKRVLLKVFLKEISKETDVETLQEKLEILSSLPVYYFSTKEKKFIKILLELDRKYSQNLKILALTRRLLVKFVKRCHYCDLLSSDVLYFLKSIDGLPNSLDVEEIRWNTILIVKDLIVNFSVPSRRIDLVSALVEYRKQCVSENLVYWEYLIFSSSYLLLAKKGYNVEDSSLLESIMIRDLSESVLENVLSGTFDSKIDFLVVNEVLKVFEKSGLVEHVVACTQRVSCILGSQSTGSKTWLLAFEVLCNWVKFLPHCVFGELLESAWANIEFQTVRNGVHRVIQLADNEKSLYLAQNILAQINLIIMGLQHCGTEPIPGNLCSLETGISFFIGFLKLFFEMDWMTGTFNVLLNL
jgi:hypothetical protein